MIRSMVLIGEKYDLLTVVAEAKTNGRRKVLCKCDCGRTKTVLLYNLKSGHTGSCGCRNYKDINHGACGTPEWYSWCEMKRRCLNTTRSDYKNYGGRGITVCTEWRNDFSKFLSDMGHRPSKSHTLERIDNEKGYSPDNCRWATLQEQNENKRNVKFYTFQGVSLTIPGWSRLIGIKSHTIRARISRGWSLSNALMTPVMCLLLFVLGGCILNLSPRQEALLHLPEPPVVATAQELRELLPAFADIPDGEYTLVPRGTMPRAEWMNPFVSDIMMPMHWDCKDFSAWADDKMGPGAAFGTVWDDDHMVNWFIDCDGNVILFDAQLGQFVNMLPKGMKI